MAACCSSFVRFFVGLVNEVVVPLLSMQRYDTTKNNTCIKDMLSCFGFVFFLGMIARFFYASAHCSMAQIITVSLSAAPPPPPLFPAYPHSFFTSLFFTPVSRILTGKMIALTGPDGKKVFESIAITLVCG